MFWKGPNQQVPKTSLLDVEATKSGMVFGWFGRLLEFSVTGRLVETCCGEIREILLTLSHMS